MPYSISHSSVRAFSILLTPKLERRHSQEATNLFNLQQHNSQEATYNLGNLAMQTPPYTLKKVTRVMCNRYYYVIVLTIFPAVTKNRYFLQLSIPTIRLMGPKP